MGQNMDSSPENSDACIEHLQKARRSSGAEFGNQEREDLSRGPDEGAEQFKELSLGAKREGAPAASNPQPQPTVTPKAQQLLCQFLKVQERRASLYAELHSGFIDYLKTGSELSFQQKCGEVTTAFNDCSRQVLEIQAALREPEVGGEEYAAKLQEVQAQEKQNLRMTATIQVLRKAGRPSERAHVHADKRGQQQCSHSHEEESSALELAELEAEYDAAYKEATRALQEARTTIHEIMEDVRCEVVYGDTA